MTTFLILLMMVIQGSFSTEEDYYGKYASVQTGVVEFTLDENGVNDLIVNHQKINQQPTYDFLGYYGSTWLLKIEFFDEQGCSNVLKVLIENDHGEFVIASGFHRRYQVAKNDRIITVNKKSFELTFKPSL